MLRSKFGKRFGSMAGTPIQVRHDIASILVEDDSESHTMNLCLKAFSGRQWKLLVGGQRSRGKLSAGLGAPGIECIMCECYAAKELCANSLLGVAATALKMGKSWTEKSP